MTTKMTADELAAKGGKIKSTVCGDQKRRCVKVSRFARLFGNTSDYMDLGWLLMAASRLSYA